MPNIAQGLPGSYELLIGNEAIARGALEAGVQFCAGYPGTPSSEIIGSLVEASKDTGIHVEWSVNEKVATEAAAAAAFAGLRALAAMKNAGLNVALDFLLHLNLTGLGDSGGALVVVTCDDPQAWSSGDETDTRWVAQIADVPLLEPAGVQEAKDMMIWAFDLSEEFRTYCLLRSYKNLSHSGSVVKLGKIPKARNKAKFDTSKVYSPYFPYFPTPRHAQLHEMEAGIQEICESSKFNSYSGPERPELLIICSGSGKLCSLDAIQALDLTESVGILKLGTLWPFPRRLVQKYLARTDKVLIAEEVDPFVETHVKLTAFESPSLLKKPEIYGKNSGHIPQYGEITPDILIKALCGILKIKYQARESSYEKKATSQTVIARNPVWCPGCPHRASFLCIDNAMKADGRDAVLSGDIGCYTLDVFPDGPHFTNVLHCMGSGAGTAVGFGQLGQFGFKKPSVAVCGDSTFFHATIPALINAVQSNSKMTLVVLDNTVTAMTGFQPNPGTGRTATGDQALQLQPEEIAKVCGVRFIRVVDPFDLKSAADTVGEALRFDGPSVIVLRRKCALVAQREKAKLGEKIAPYIVDQEKCIKRVLAGKENLMPCAASCPAGNDIPAILNLVKQGKLSEALELIRQTNPLPAVLGRVCYHACEANCNRGQLDEAIAIQKIERLLGDYGLSSPNTEKPALKRKEKVAVIGSGPAGLSCAYHLARMGYPVTVFEALPSAGGMPAIGIPEYRLPKDILQNEIKAIEDLGVEIRLNTRVASVNKLLEQGYSAVFVGVGAHRDMRLGVLGEDKDGVISALSFLRQVNLGRRVSTGNKVVVVGGGNVAIDSARVAVRLGARDVSIIYRRSRGEMPASDDEIKAAEEEGVSIIYLAAPKEILGDGKVTGLVCTRMRLGAPDASGRARPIPIKGSEFTIVAQTVIAAIGQEPDLSFVGKALPISPQKTLLVDPNTMATTRLGIFGGGDVVTGPAMVADAVGAGRKAAISIDRYLKGKPIKVKEKKTPVLSYEELDATNIPLARRAEASKLPAAKRVKGFAEIESGLLSDVAVAESQRCLACGAFGEKCVTLLHCPAIIRDSEGNTRIDDFLCNGCGVCAKICPHQAIMERG
jgi:indolepyruvate ferredoxin oxidoreductase alpha subunit